MKSYYTFLCMLAAFLTAQAQTLDELSWGFTHPQDTARTKVWWFFGETPTTREGITADLEAFKWAGVGGVVYYDQVHGSGEGADLVFSPQWWQGVVFASQEAKRLGLSFEANIGNGYVAGGKWITPDKSMQRLAMTELLVDGEQVAAMGQVALSLPQRPRDWHEEVAVLALPYDASRLGDSRLLHAEMTGRDDGLVFDFGHPFTARSIIYEVTGQGKAHTSSMQVPPTHRPLQQTDPTHFFGCGFTELPGIGVLEASDDNVNYTKVCDLTPRYKNFGGLKQQTVSFPAMRGRYFRVRLTSTARVSLSEVVVSARACIDHWEEKASLVSAFIDGDATPAFSKEELVNADSIVDLSDRLTPDGMLSWPSTMKGQWLVVRLVAVSTGGRTKHGRAEALGLECDKLSVDGARQHWQCYTKPLIDTIRAHGGALQGICMDSHEAGPQNWTHDMPQQFRRLRGYDMKPFLLTMAGGMEIGGRGASFLKDLRRTISDLITENYYGEFQRLCRQEGLTLTAQAVGGALCMAGDNIEVKKLIDKPQGEFWGYQTEGNYDIKDCASAAHVYGKQIASGEAFTDITYKHSLADIKNLADYAYAFGINEFVVCASAYQPYPNLLNTANGRQYALNRMNTLWPMSRPFWDYQARCSWMLRQGKPVSDLLLYLGDDVPKRTLTHLLPPIPQGYDFDALTTDALLHRVTVSNGRLTLPDGVSYSMLLLPPDEELTPAVRRKVEQLRVAGAHVWSPRHYFPPATGIEGGHLNDALQQAAIMPDVDAPLAQRLYHCHRQTPQSDIYFLNNHSDDTIAYHQFLFHTQAVSAQLWHPVTGQQRPLATTTTDDGRTAIRLSMAPRESFFIVFSRLGQAESLHSTAVTNEPQWSVTAMLQQPWEVTFDEHLGGPAGTVVFRQLTDWTRHADPRIRYFSGTATYRTTFKLSQKDTVAHYQLAFTAVGTAARILVNGHEAGTIWCSPWTIDVTPFLRKGKNTLEVSVANCLWNRLVGDATRPETERLMQQTTPLAKPDDELIGSGLSGGVMLMHTKPNP